MNTPQLSADAVINSLIDQIAEQAARTARAIAERDAYIAALQAPSEPQADAQGPQADAGVPSP